MMEENHELGEDLPRPLTPTPGSPRADSPPSTMSTVMESPPTHDDQSSRSTTPAESMDLGENSDYEPYEEFICKSIYTEEKWRERMRPYLKEDIVAECTADAHSTLIAASAKARQAMAEIIESVPEVLRAKGPIGLFGDKGIIDHIYKTGLRGERPNDPLYVFFPDFLSAAAVQTGDVTTAPSASRSLRPAATVIGEVRTMWTQKFAGVAFPLSPSPLSPLYPTKEMREKQRKEKEKARERSFRKVEAPLIRTVAKRVGFARILQSPSADTHSPPPPQTQTPIITQAATKRLLPPPPTALLADIKSVGVYGNPVLGGSFSVAIFRHLVRMTPTESLFPLAASCKLLFALCMFELNTREMPFFCTPPTLFMSVPGVDWLLSLDAPLDDFAVAAVKAGHRVIIRRLIHNNVPIPLEAFEAAGATGSIAMLFVLFGTHRAENSSRLVNSTRCAAALHGNIDVLDFLELIQSSELACEENKLAVYRAALVGGQLAVLRWLSTHGWDLMRLAHLTALCPPRPLFHQEECIADITSMPRPFRENVGASVHDKYDTLGTDEESSPPRKRSCGQERERGHVEVDTRCFPIPIGTPADEVYIGPTHLSLVQAARGAVLRGEGVDFAVLWAGAARAGLPHLPRLFGDPLAYDFVLFGGCGARALPLTWQDEVTDGMWPVLPPSIFAYMSVAQLEGAVAAGFIGPLGDDARAAYLAAWKGRNYKLLFMLATVAYLPEEMNACAKAPGVRKPLTRLMIHLIETHAATLSMLVQFSDTPEGKRFFAAYSAKFVLPERGKTGGGYLELASCGRSFAALDMAAQLDPRWNPARSHRLERAPHAMLLECFMRGAHDPACLSRIVWEAPLPVANIDSICRAKVAQLAGWTDEAEVAQALFSYCEDAIQTAPTSLLLATAFDVMARTLPSCAMDKLLPVFVSTAVKAHWTDCLSSLGRFICKNHPHADPKNNSYYCLRQQIEPLTDETGRYCSVRYEKRTTLLV